MKIFKRILFVIILCTFIFCLANVALSLYAGYVANADYDASKDIVKIPEITTAPPDTPEPTDEFDEVADELLHTTDIAALKAQNPDVVGWIIIPDTNISFPIVQGADNERYLYHTWLGKWSWAGSIYLDFRVQKDFTDHNTIVYGHNMGGGEMFSDLLLYGEQEFYDAHPCVYVVTEGRVRRYDIFSAYESDLEVDKTFTINFTTDEKRTEYIEQCAENSEIACKEPDENAKIMTLATCTQTGYYDYKTRWVVQAYLAYEVMVVD